MSSIMLPLSSFRELKRFFVDSPQIEEVLKHSQESFSVTSRATQRLNSRWYICQIATAPFRQIASVFLRALSSSCNLIGLKSAEKKLEEKITSLQEGFIDTKLANIHIADSLNCYDGKLDFTGDVDSKIFSMIQEGFLNQDLQIEWGFLSKGACQGSSIWFVYLYFKTHASFQDPKAHIAFLSNLFANEPGAEAALLQFFDLKKIVEFLDLTIDLERGKSMKNFNRPVFEKTNPNALCSLRLEETTNFEKINTTINQLKQLPNGAYIVIFKGHGAAYIKTETHSFLFDPNQGTFDVDLQEPNCDLLLHQILTTLATNHENFVNARELELSLKKNTLSLNARDVELVKNMVQKLVQKYWATLPNIEFIPISTAQIFYP